MLGNRTMLRDSHEYGLGAIQRPPNILFIAATALLACSGCMRSNDVLLTCYGEEYSRTAYERGTADAQDDLKKGKLSVEQIGLPSRWQAEYESILRGSYGTELKQIGDVVNADIIGHGVGYNEVMGAELRRRFGYDVLKAADSDAERLHVAKKDKVSR